jgi:hypothetical protein
MGHTETHDWYQAYIVPLLAGSGVLPGTPVQVTYKVFSPVALLIVDAAGRRLGYDPATGAPVNDFGSLASDSGLNSEPESLAISMGSVVPGLYQVSGIGTGTGPYHIELQITSEANPSEPIFDQIIASGIVTPNQPIAPIAAMNLVQLATGQTLTVTAPANQDATEGVTQSIGLGSFSDLNGGPWTVDVNWGDGTPDTIFSTTTPGSLGTQNHSYGGEGGYTVTVNVANSAQQSDSAVFQVGVTDAPLIATGVNVSVTVGTPFSGVVAIFNDAAGAGPVSKYSASIDWGDTTGPDTNMQIVANAGGGFRVLGSHTYAGVSPTPYPVIVTITDQGGSSAVATKSPCANQLHGGRRQE